MGICNIPRTHFDWQWQLYTTWLSAIFHDNNFLTAACTQHGCLQHTLWLTVESTQHNSVCSILNTHLTEMFTTWMSTTSHALNVYTLIDNSCTQDCLQHSMYTLWLTACLQHKRLQHSVHCMHILWLTAVHNINVYNIPCTHFHWQLVYKLSLCNTLSLWFLYTRQLPLTFHTRFDWQLVTTWETVAFQTFLVHTCY